MLQVIVLTNFSQLKPHFLVVIRFVNVRLTNVVCSVFSGDHLKWKHYGLSIAHGFWPRQILMKMQSLLSRGIMPLYINSARLVFKV